MIAIRIAGQELRRVRSEATPVAWLGLAVLSAIVAVAVLSPLTGYVPALDVHPDARSLGPSAAHWLGTDHLGRDIFNRLLLASRAFVFPGLLAALAATSLGTALGAASGWWGHSVGAVVRWATATLASLPRFVWVLLVCAAWGDASAQLGLAVGVAYAPTVAEAVHARLESLRASEYLLAARAHGVSELRLLAIHGLIAGCSRLILRHGLLCFGFFLVVETTLAYIGGFGLSEPDPSLGNMLAFEWGWSLGALAPAIGIWVAIASVTTVADALGESAHG